MGEEMNLKGCLFFGDGTKFCEVEEIPEFVETQDNTPLHPMLTDTEATATFQMSPRSRKAFVREMMGWKAKGPMRTRAVEKARMQMWKNVWVLCPESMD